MTERLTIEQALAQLPANTRAGRGGMKATKKKAHPEQDEQERLFVWIRAFEGEYAPLGYLRGSLNGVYLHPTVSATAQKMGMRKGEWDVFMDYPSEVRELTGKCIKTMGLYIEMKWGKNKLTDSQEAFMKMRPHHEFRVCYSAKEAAYCILEYAYDKNGLEVPEALSKSLKNPLYFPAEEFKKGGAK